MRNDKYKEQDVIELKGICQFKFLNEKDYKKSKFC